MVRRQGGGPWEEYQDPSLAAVVAGILDHADAAELLERQEVVELDARTSPWRPAAPDIEFLEFGESGPEGFLAVRTDGVHIGQVYASAEELELATGVNPSADLPGG